MNGRTTTLELIRDKITKATDKLYQYDYGQKVQFTGVELPAAYEAHFSNSYKGNSYNIIADSNIVNIPDECLLSGDPVYVWVFLHETSEDGETEYHGIIPVIHRAKRTMQTPTPAQQDALDQAIAIIQGAGSQLQEAYNQIAEASQLIRNFQIYIDHNKLVINTIPTEEEPISEYDQWTYVINQASERANQAMQTAEEALAAAQEALEQGGITPEEQAMIAGTRDDLDELYGAINNIGLDVEDEHFVINDDNN